MKFRKFIKQFKPGEDVNVIYHGINVYTGPVADLPEIYSMGMHDVVTSEVDKEMPILNVEIENSSYCEESETLFVRAHVLCNYQDGRMRVALLASGADGITFTTDDKSLIKLGEIEEEIRGRVGRELIQGGSVEGKK